LAPSWISLTLSLPVSLAMVKLRQDPQLRRSILSLNLPEADILVFSAWHLFKYIDPAESGAVLPIVHVNGYKISQRTIYGTMDDKEIAALFRCVCLGTPALK
jgi:hypothetical protein